MPVLVSKDIAVNDITLGDLLAGDKVTVVDRKVKWVTITTENGATVRVKRDDVLTIERSERTPEERAIEEEAEVRRSIASEIRIHRRRLAEAKKRLATQATADGDISSSAFSMYLDARAEWEPYRLIEWKMDEERGDKRVTDLKEAALAVRKHVVKRLINEARNGHSWYSDGVRTAEELAKGKGYGAFIDDMEWILPSVMQ